MLFGKCHILPLSSLVFTIRKTTKFDSSKNLQLRSYRCVQDVCFGNTSPGFLSVCCCLTDSLGFRSACVWTASQESARCQGSKLEKVRVLGDQPPRDVPAVPTRWGDPEQRFLLNLSMAMQIEQSRASCEEVLVRYMFIINHFLLVCLQHSVFPLCF